ncbi:MAG: arsenate reductase ArsC [Epsilonproteobacteria bacterium]|nr:arsenate reductase ArsC [Campylobacterota bacterium]
MKKKVLVLCTGNSCRSIIAQALLLKEGFLAQSAGSKPTKKVHPLAKRLLQNYNLWKDEFYSKGVDEVEGEFDLVVTVCDNAKEECATYFKQDIPKIHIPFTDPANGDYEQFEKTLKEMQERLIPKVKKLLS